MGRATAPRSRTLHRPAGTASRGSALAALRDPVWGATFTRWGLVGILVRLLLLPVGVSSDMLAVYWRSHVIAFHGGVFERYLVNMGSHAVHAAWLRVVQPLMGPADQLWTHPWWWAEPVALVPSHVNALLARFDAARVLTLLKLPYILADLAAGLVLLALLWPRDGPVSDDAARRARTTWILWMLSPAALYATLIFGRYESFPVLAVLAALLLAERRRTLAAAIVLGLAVTLRTYPIVLVPVFALVVYRDLPRQVGWAALAVAPFAATMVANRVVGGSYGELAAVGDYPFGGNWFAFTLQPDRGGPGVLLFAAALLALGGYLLGRSRGWWGVGVVATGDLWRWVALAHLAMFAFAQFSAHYLAWIVPAVALVAGRTPARGVVPLHLAQVAGVFVAAAVLWGGGLFAGALGGLGDTARDLLPFGPLLEGPRGKQVADLAWTTFWVATLAIALPLLRDSLRPGRAGRPLTAAG
ncbi:MAG: hypothetical protein KY462_15540 [Actinobacteria bacterium]|nr:hypothetical protein [Actinomycetota bacterium]